MSSLNAPNLSIIIVNYNGKHLLEPCITSIFDTYGDLPLDIWVVDNGSNDGTISWLRDTYPTIRLIENSENLGFARANNQALAVCLGKYILLLNNDTVVRKGALQHLVRILDANPEFAAVGPKLLNVDGSIQPSCMHFPSLWRAPIGYVKALVGGSAKYSLTNQDEVSSVDAVTGACMLMRREALTSVGMLDQDFFMYAEEVDWCFRAYKQGWKIGYVPSAEVIHLGGQSAGREPHRFYVQRRFGRVHFHYKHYGRASAYAVAWVIRANILFRWLIHPDQRQDFAQILRSFDLVTSSLFGHQK